MNPVKYIPLDCIYGTEIKIEQDKFIALIERIYCDSRNDVLAELDATRLCNEGLLGDIRDARNHALEEAALEADEAARRTLNSYTDPHLISKAIAHRVRALKHKDGQP